MATEAKHYRERRWVIVSPDGRYVTLGRESDPDEKEILAAEEALRARGLAGWLAVMEGSPYVGHTPRLMEIRALASPAESFLEAAEACIRRIEIERISSA